MGAELPFLVFPVTLARVRGEGQRTRRCDRAPQFTPVLGAPSAPEKDFTRGEKNRLQNAEEGPKSVLALERSVQPGAKLRPEPSGSVLELPAGGLAAEKRDRSELFDHRVCPGLQGRFAAFLEGAQKREGE